MPSSDPASPCSSATATAPSSNAPPTGAPGSDAAPSLHELSGPDLKLVKEEADLAQRVRKRLQKHFNRKKDSEGASTKKPISDGSLDAQLIALRDQIYESRPEDVPALLAEMDRLSAVNKVKRPESTGAVDPRAPYFGHLRLKENGRSRDVLIGKRGMIDRDAGVVIVDWRNAPVSRIYYRYEEGDDYEEEFGEEIREGDVEVRRTVTFDESKLVRVRAPEGTFLVRPDDEGPGTWIAVGLQKTVELKGGAGVASRAPRKERSTFGHSTFGHAGPAYLRPDKHLPEIAALIDPTQFDAMTQSDSGVIVLQGGAGSGKTTVALHRIAYLAFSDRHRFRTNHMLVVVHQPALVKYVERVLPSLEIGGVKVRSSLDWSRYALSRIVQIKRRHIDEASAEAAALKKHPGILKAIEKQIQNRWEQAHQAVMRAVAGKDGGGQVLATLSSHQSLPLLVGLRAFIDDITNQRSLPKLTKEAGLVAVERVRHQARNLVSEWEELITDRGLLAPVQEGPFALDDATLHSAMRWTSSQVDDLESDDVEGDGDEKAASPYVESLERGSDDDDRPSRAFDPHDPFVMLNMWIARTGALRTRDGGALRYDHIAVDEAQDLSAVEVRPLLVAAGKRRSLTLAGDIVQKVVFDNGFDEWATLLEQLGTSAVQVKPFKLSYRSTAEVVALARHVLGHLAPKDPPSAVRSGAPVEVFSFYETGEEMAFLAENLRALMGREPNASVAVLTRYPERAAFYAKMLAQAEVPKLRLVADADFSFTPGIDVTHIAQVKGLEYDYVVLAEVTEPMYPAQDVARHLLHIGATRAAYQLWMTTSVKQPSPLLPITLLDELTATNHPKAATPSSGTARSS